MEEGGNIDAVHEEQFLELANVNVARGDRVVLHDVNLTIRAGEHVAILGPNGCGKSTLIFTITCQIYPIVQTGMRVRIFGRERWDLTQLRKHFGVVGAGLMGELPGERTAVTTGLDAVIAGFFSASTLWPNLHVTEEMRERAREALGRMEATHLAEQLVGEMSAGEKRRIMIARALVHRPRQLLLDEPSLGLAPSIVLDMFDAIRRIHADGIAVLLVEQNVSMALDIAERAAVLEEGRIVALGRPEELMARPELRRAYLGLDADHATI